MSQSHTPEVKKIIDELQDDDKVKVAGIDADGMLRGKIISKNKFLSIFESGFGFCSVIFGWDMHDRMYSEELSVSNSQNGCRDLIARIDIESFRRIPWERNEETLEPIAPCPRGLLLNMVRRLEDNGWEAMGGVEYEFYNFKETPRSLSTSKGRDLEHLTPGMFGYSITRPVQNQRFYYDVFDACKKFDINIEGWHTESGPGVYEAALEFGEISKMADRASLFKYVVKAIGSLHGIMPCFMAKPIEGLPGNSGHIHLSLVEAESGKNLFARTEKNPNPTYPDLAYISEMGEQFLAGILDGLSSIMPILAPTINSYKRLVEKFWAPVTISWGLEHRAASVRVVSPPTSSTISTRFEIRTPGADANPHYVLAAILGSGLRGIEKKLELKIPPLGKGEKISNSPDGNQLGLARNLGEAVEKMVAKDSVARQVLGDKFVDHFAGTRIHEIKLFEQAVTDWEVRRYIETV